MNGCYENTGIHRRVLKVICNFAFAGAARPGLQLWVWQGTVHHMNGRNVKNYIECIHTSCCINFYHMMH